jgi:ABC-type sugar transport system ATPase subunit
VASRGGTAHVELRGVSKRFGAVVALNDIDLAIGRGAIHALVGENGAGKSTLGKIITGGLRQDTGSLVVNGRDARYRHPSDALRDGLTMIAQELTLVPAMTVAQNVFLGTEPTHRGFIDRGSQRKRYAELDESTGFGIPGDLRVAALSVADRQKVEILRALARRAELIVMDEPTAALGKDEAARFLGVVRRLRRSGVTILYISHFLEEVLSLADTVTVLRDGVRIQTAPSDARTPETLVAAMLGRSLDLAFPPKSPPAPDAAVVLSVRGIAREPVVKPTDLAVRRGEIVGVAGLVGSGRSELARLIFGAEKPSAGSIAIDGRVLRIRGPHPALRAGIAMLPESRREQGLIMQRSIAENITLTRLRQIESVGLLSKRAEAREAAAAMRRVDVRAGSPANRVDTLSGGNQQKALFAKWLFANPRVLIADEPTRGVDVGAKRAIYQLIHRLAAGGLGILLISSELEEILGLCHRILVMRGGEIVAEFDGRDADEDTVLQAAFGMRSGRGVPTGGDLR